eukprot:TRINITY_DN20554_c0_g1_i1.p1 TRINITY_DN20554_c0_g1~~TRINITY_DN20554_c0_g1_i1.p1  ORF type:complete len:296 (+),score=73.47 TRINITY_DN20554_c0_g1_i1:44-889(+)
MCVRDRAYILIGHQDLFLPFLHSTAGGIGSMLFLVCTPVGFGRIISWTWGLWLVPFSFGSRQLRIESLTLMIRSLEEKLARAGHARGLCLDKSELERLETERSLVRNSTPIQIVLSNVAFVLLFPAGFLVAVLILVRLATNQLMWCLNAVLPVGVGALVQGVQASVALGWCGWGICSDFVYDAVLMLYFVVATFTGLDLIAQRHAPHNQDASDCWAIGGAVLLSGTKLLLSCSVPVAVRLLELDTMNQLDIELYLGINLWFKNPTILQICLLYTSPSPRDS